jgi:hypothetical protein
MIIYDRIILLWAGTSSPLVGGDSVPYKDWFLVGLQMSRLSSILTHENLSRVEFEFVKRFKLKSLDQARRITIRADS